MFEPSELVKITWDNMSSFSYGYFQCEISYGIVLKRHDIWSTNYFVYDFRRKTVIEYFYNHLEKINK